MNLHLKLEPLHFKWFYLPDKLHLLNLSKHSPLKWLFHEPPHLVLLYNYRATRSLESTKAFTFNEHHFQPTVWVTTSSFFWDMLSLSGTEPEGRLKVELPSTLKPEIETKFEADLRMLLFFGNISHFSPFFCGLARCIPATYFVDGCAWMVESLDSVVMTW